MPQLVLVITTQTAYRTLSTKTIILNGMLGENIKKKIIVKKKKYKNTILI